jgi:hypothetical protein
MNCPQCQATLTLADPAPGKAVTCPKCQLRFVLSSAPGTSSGGRAWLPLVLLAIGVGLGVGGVIWYQNRNPNPEPNKIVENKPAPSADNKAKSTDDKDNLQAKVESKQNEIEKSNAKPEVKAEIPNPMPPVEKKVTDDELPDFPKPSVKPAPKPEVKKPTTDVPVPVVGEKPAPPPVVGEKPVPPPVVGEKPVPPPVVGQKPLPPPLVGEKPPLPPVKPVVPEAPASPKQPQINEAIAKGVAWLKKEQLPNGTWARFPTTNFVPFTYHVGYASFGGLTLLECGVPADDPAVQKAADYVRNTPIKDKMHRTYEMSSAILFLSRLGDKRDEPLIQAYALQIVAGQGNKGGWSYVCPDLVRSDMQQLLNFLQATRLNVPEAKDPLQGATAKGENDPPAKGGKEPVKPAPKKPPVPPVQSLARQIAMIPVVYHYYNNKLPPSGPQLPMAVVPMQVQPNVNPNVNPVDIVLPTMPEDNSNTQFAMLALWAARRHGVPTERVLLLAGQRFAASQNDDGGWGYQDAGMLIKNASTPTMTCVGLLGLAMAHASTPAKGAAPAKLPEDPRIAKALSKLGNHVDATEMRNFYLLWSIERVGVLYDLKSLGNRDWYEVGVEMLLPAQEDDGKWSVQSYAGSTNALDTCFALLFLRRSNLVQDLTQRLPLLMSIPDRTPRR